MSEIDAAIDVFEKQIQALYTNDFEKFLSFMTPRIRNELTLDSFQKAIDLYKRTPIDREAVDIENSILFSEGESVEIPDRHVKLILKVSGRTLCHIVDMKGVWLIDDIYWQIEDIKVSEETDTNEINTESFEKEPEESRIEKEENSGADNKEEDDLMDE
jgi:hypothetical protein